MRKKAEAKLHKQKVKNHKTIRNHKTRKLGIKVKIVVPIILVNIAVEESANGINHVSEVSVNIVENVNGIQGQANSNLTISDSLKTEVNKFTIQ